MPALKKWLPLPRSHPPPYKKKACVGPSPNGPQFSHMRYIHPGGVTQVDHESAQLSRLEAVVVAAPKSLPVFCLCASVEATTFCLEIPLQSRQLATVSPPPPGETVTRYGGGRLQGGGHIVGVDGMRGSPASSVLGGR